MKEKAGFAALYASKRLLNRLGIVARVWRQNNRVNAYVVTPDDWHRIESYYVNDDGTRAHIPSNYQEKPVLAWPANSTRLETPTGEHIQLV